MEHDFWLGVNYWPADKAMYWWKAFDDRQVNDDFRRIAELGLRVVRICLMWEDFQPEPDLVDPSQLDNLAAVLDIAQRHSLLIIPTLLVGNMSGIMWFPPWAFTTAPEAGTSLQMSQGQYVRRELRSPFDDPFMLRAESRLAEAVAGRLRGHPALHSFDLANEIDQAYLPRSADSGWLWAWTLRHAIHEGDGDALVSYGAHILSLTTNGLAIPALSSSLDFLSMHSYPIYSEAARGPLDPDFVPFMTLLTARLGNAPCLMQEFGLCTAPPGEPSHTVQDDFLGTMRPQFMASEEDEADYYSAVLDRLWQVGALGALAWNYSDYAPSLWDRPPLDKAKRERTFGLLRADGSAKPAVQVIQRFGAEVRSGAIERRLGPHGGKTPRLDIDPDAYYRDPEMSFRGAYGRYRAALQ